MCILFRVKAGGIYIGTFVDYTGSQIVVRGRLRLGENWAGVWEIIFDFIL